MADIPLYLFAKAPVAGKVKRRMSPPLRALQCAQLANALLEHSATQVERGWAGAKVLNVSPDLTHSSFNRFVSDEKWRTRAQSPVDLGERMGEALTEGISACSAAAVLGTDIPAIQEEILGAAYRSLSAGRHVVGPSADGGFYLLGLAAEVEGLFAGIEWGQSCVFTRLIENANRLGLEFDLLPRLHDCDYYADLQRAVDEVPNFAQRLLDCGLDISPFE